MNFSASSLSSVAFGRLTPLETSESRAHFVKELEVWRTATGQFDEGKHKTGNAYIELPGILRDESYGADLRDLSANSNHGNTIIGGLFEKLYEGVDYIYHERTGFITFKTQVQRADAIAVVYRIEGPTSDPSDDIIFGEFNTAPGDTVMVLKLVTHM